MSGENKWTDVINLLLGAWLATVPLTSHGGMSVALAWNAIIVGCAVAILAIVAMARPRRWQEWINLFLGMWIFSSPMVLSAWNSEWVLWNHMLVGAGVTSFAAWAVVMRQRLHSVAL